ncbi:MAG: AMP-binding protein [bacterium]
MTSPGTRPKATGTLTVGNILRVAAARFADKEAVYCSATGRRFSFRRLNERANRLAGGLTSLGLSKGDVAAFLCTNRAEILEIYFALAKTGVIGIPINYRLAPAEMIELMRYCDAQALLFDPWFPEVAAQVQPKLSRVKHFIGMGENLPAFATGYEGLLAASSPEEPKVEISEEDYHYFNLTSGTTGLPKAYLLTNYNNATAIVMALMHDLTPGDVILTAFPIFGRVGFAWCALGLITGARVVIHQFQAQKMLELIQSERVTISNWVPTMASFVLAQPDLEKYDLSSLRALVFSAAPLPQSLQQQVRKRICPNLYEYYGLQETGILTQLGPEEKNRKPDSVGKVVFTAEVRIVDHQDRDLPAGEVGQILGRAPAATGGYFKNEEKTREVFRDGWVHTGDLGRFDEEGFLYLAGRAKDMIISGGQNVFSVEVEDTLMSHPAVADCAVIGLPDETWGEKVTAVVVKAPGAQVSEEELIRHCKERIAGFKTPKTILWWEGLLPRTPTGKVTKFVLVEKYSKS